METTVNGRGTEQPIPQDESLDKGGRIHMEDAAIFKRADLLPPEMREPFIWLSQFCRNTCDRNIALLTEKFKAVGVDTTKSTWVKIIKGQWNTDTMGQLRENPVMAKARFIQEITALRENTRVETMRGKQPFIPTSVSKMIFDYINLRRPIDRINRFGIIVGETGTQKTATGLEYKRLHPHTHLFQCPEGGSVHELAVWMGRQVGLYKQSYGERLKISLFNNVRAHTAFLLDNAQDLFQEPKRKAKNDEAQELFSFVRRLQEETGCVIIFFITPEFEKQLLGGLYKKYFEQFIGRCGGEKKILRLPSPTPPLDVVKISEGFGLIDAKANQKKLIDISRQVGGVRILCDALQDGKRLAEADQAKFTFSYVEDAA